MTHPVKIVEIMIANWTLIGIIWTCLATATDLFGDPRDFVLGLVWGDTTLLLAWILIRLNMRRESEPEDTDGDGQ